MTCVSDGMTMDDAHLCRKKRSSAAEASSTISIKPWHGSFRETLKKLLFLRPQYSVAFTKNVQARRESNGINTHRV